MGNAYFSFVGTGVVQYYKLRFEDAAASYK